MEVFFTVPCAVANMRYSSAGKSFVAMTAAMLSPSASGSRFTMAVPRACGRLGQLVDLQTVHLALVEKNSM